MRDPNQKMRYTIEELGLVKSLFADSEDLLFIIRKVMLQFPLNEQEKAALKAVMNEQVSGLMRKTFLPTLDPDAPMFQLTDLRIALGTDIKDCSVDSAWPFIRAKDIEMDYLNHQLKVLDGNESSPPILMEDLANLKLSRSKREDLYINVVARNFLLSFIDSNLAQLKALAGRKEESVEETLSRLAKDSSK